MSIFVVGASGMLGRKIADALEGGLIVRRISTNAPNMTDRLDLRSPFAFDYGEINPGDTVVLVAAIASPDRCAEEHELARAVNVTGTTIVIEQCLNRGARVIFTSSDVVLGDTEDEVFEDAPRRPVGPYAEMKAEIERRFELSSDVSVLRLSYVVSGEDSFVSHLRACRVEKRPARVFDALRRRVIALTDVVGAVVAICGGSRADHGLVNLAGPELLSRRALAEIYAQATTDRLEVETAEPPPDFFARRPHTINMGSMRLDTLLGRPPVSMTEAIATLISREAHSAALAG